MRSFLAPVFAALLVAGCHGGSPAADLSLPPDLAEPVDMAFPRAAYPTLPQVPTSGGPVLAHPKLVTISVTGDATEAAVKVFGDWVVQSTWLTAVGAEYGVGAGTHVHATLPTLPASLYISGIEGQISAAIGAGQLPAVDENTLYMIYVPSTTTLTDWSTSQCAAHNGTYSPAFHSSTFGASPPFAYAVIPTCPPLKTEGLEQASSHELIEAATNPLVFVSPGFEFPMLDPWFQTGGEIGDICNQTITVDGHYVTQVWSNAGAARGDTPCVPAITPYYGASPSPTSATLSPGQTAQFVITGWSTDAIGPWSVAVGPGLYSPPVTAKLDVMQLGNGDVGHLSVTAPIGAQPGTALTVLLYSGMPGGQLVHGDYPWPIAINIK